MERPKIVTVCGVLNLVFAAGVIKLLLSGAYRARAFAHHSAAAGSLQGNPVYAFWSQWTGPLSLLGLVLLLVSGIGLLRLKEWARKLSIVYGVYAMLKGAAMSVTNFVFILQPLLARTSFTAGGYIVPRALTAEISAIIAGLLSLVYPLVLIVSMTRPEIIAAFRPPAAPSGPPSPK